MDNNFETQTQNPYTEEQYNQNPYNQNPYAQNPYAQNTQAGGEFYPPSYNPLAFLSEEQKEKRAIKKKMTGVGTAFIVLFVIMQFWFIPFSIIAGILGFSSYDVNSFLQNEYFSYATHVLFSSACFTIPFIILARKNKRTISELVPLKKAEKGTALPFFLFGMAMCALSNLFSSATNSLLNAFLSVFGLKYDLSTEITERGVLIFILAVLSTAVVPALVEEFACRGVMFGLLKEHSEGMAIIVTSVIFGIVHSNFVQIPFAFMMGLSLAVIRIKTGTLWIAVLVHFLNNFVSVLFEYVFYPLPEDVQNVIYFVYLMICLLAGIIGVLLIAKKSPETFSLKANENGISEKSLISTALTRPTVIVLTVACILVSLLFIQPI